MNHFCKYSLAVIIFIMLSIGFSTAQEEEVKVERWLGESQEYHCGDRIGAGGFYYSECKDVSVCWNERWGMFESDEDSVLNDSYYRQNFKEEAELRNLDCDSFDLKELYYSIIKADFIPNADLCTIATKDDGSWHTSENHSLYSVLRFVQEAQRRGLKCDG